MQPRAPNTTANGGACRMRQHWARCTNTPGCPHLPHQTSAAACCHPAAAPCQCRRRPLHCSCSQCTAIGARQVMSHDQSQPVQTGTVYGSGKGLHRKVRNVASTLLLSAAAIMSQLWYRRRKGCAWHSAPAACWWRQHSPCLHAAVSYHGHWLPLTACNSSVWVGTAPAHPPKHGVSADS